MLGLCGLGVPTSREALHLMTIRTLPFVIDLSQTAVESLYAARQTLLFASANLTCILGWKNAAELSSSLMHVVTYCVSNTIQPSVPPSVLSSAIADSILLALWLLTTPMLCPTPLNTDRVVYSSAFSSRLGRRNGIC